jgi:hypothetical protein
MKKYSKYSEAEDDNLADLTQGYDSRSSSREEKRSPGMTSPTSIETSSIDLQLQKVLNLTSSSSPSPRSASKYSTHTPTKPSSSSSAPKYLTPGKNESLNKYVTPSKMPRQTSGGGKNDEDLTPIKSPFSETLPDGILLTPVKSSAALSPTTPLHHKKLHSLFSPPPTGLHQTHLSTPSHQIAPQYTPDVVSRTIFQALFGASTKSVTSSLPWDEEDDEEEGDEIGADDLYHCKSVEPVDEVWFTRLMSTSLLTTQALDYALHNSSGSSSTSFFQQQINRGPPFRPLLSYSPSAPPTPPLALFPLLQVSLTTSLGNPISTPEDLLSNYINPSFITSLITHLPFEDERFTSPRLSVLKAIYKAVPKFRSLIANSLLSVSNQRFMRCKTSSKLAIMYELDVNHTGTKIGDMFSYSLDQHVDPQSAYSCFPIDDISYPPNKTSRSPSPASAAAPLTPVTRPHPHLTPQISSTQQQNTTNTATPAPLLTRDHDISIIEMTLFMIITSDYDMNCLSSSPSSTSIPSLSSTAIASPPAPTCLAPALAPCLFRIFLSIVVAVLRCYGRRLGKTTEGVEQPNVLKSCLRALEEITNRVEGEEIEKIIVPTLLHSWPGGGNSVREAAFLKVQPTPPLPCPASVSSTHDPASRSSSLSFLTGSWSGPPSL